MRFYSASTLIYLFVIICALIGFRNAPNVIDVVSGRVAVSLDMGDKIDAGAIVRGLERAPHFTATLKWWSGSWGAVTSDGEQIKFYRPATATLWWLQLKIFGDQSARGFLALHVFWHLAVAVMALAFLRRLAGLRVALLALIIWTLNMCWFAFFLPAPVYALASWKDDPDMTVTLCILASCLAFLNWSRRPRETLLATALCFFALGICFKEQAYVLPALLGLVLWHERKLSLHWRVLVPFVLLDLAAFVLRLWALQGLGFRFGTNGSWLPRWLFECVGGSAAAAIYRYDTLPLALALACFAAGALWRFRQRPARRTFYAIWFAILIVGAAFFISIGDMLSGLEPGTALSRLLLPLPLDRNTWLGSALATIALLWMFKLFVEQRPRVQTFAYGWLLVAYAPLMTAPITQHALYLMSLGWALWFAWPLAQWSRSWRLPKRASAHRWRQYINSVRWRREKHESRLRCG